MDAKHSKGPWVNREGEIIADTRTYTCCAQPTIGAQYMGQQEELCCGRPDVDGCEEDVIARVTYECDIPLITAAPELLEVCKAFADHMSGPTAWTQDQEDALIAQVHAVIAKATGA